MTNSLLFKFTDAPVVQQSGASHGASFIDWESVLTIAVIASMHMAHMHVHRWMMPSQTCTPFPGLRSHRSLIQHITVMTNRMQLQLKHLWCMVFPEG